MMYFASIRKLLIIQLLTIIAFGQDQAITQTDYLDVDKIEEKAKVDAKSDFHLQSNPRWSKYYIGALLGLAVAGNFIEDQLSENLSTIVITGLAIPALGSLVKRIEIPEHRKKELAGKSPEYQSIYSSKYIAAIKKQRMKTLFFGTALFGVIMIAIGALLTIGIVSILY